MRSNSLLRNFVNARNIIVKQSSLKAKSEASFGLFRGYKMKLALQHELPIMTETADVLEHAKKLPFIDHSYSAIGEQAGVERKWIIQEIGDGEVLGYCTEAVNYMGYLVEEAHFLFGCKDEFEEVSFNLKHIQIMLETDLDPSILEKWQ